MSDYATKDWRPPPPFMRVMVDRLYANSGHVAGRALTLAEADRLSRMSRDERIEYFEARKINGRQAEEPEQAPALRARGGRRYK